MSDPHEHHLSRIVTHWSIVRQAHAPSGDEQRAAAQQALLDRYIGAVRRYLIATLRDRDAAEEVVQDFSLRFLRGDFHAASPDHGKFRAFLKTIIQRMAVDWHRQRQRRERHETHPHVEATPDDSPMEPSADDASFLASWREELLARTWDDLREFDRVNHTEYFQVLHHRAHHDAATSAELAETLSTLLKRPISSGNVRVLIHRARERFAESLIREVQDSLSHDDLDLVEQELIELRLHTYCKDTLQRMRADRRSTHRS